MIALYQELKKHGDKIQDLWLDHGQKRITYKEHGREYMIDKIGDNYFLHSAGITASEFKGMEQIRDFIIFGLV